MSRHRRRAAGAALAVTAALIAGCAGTSGPASPAAGPAGSGAAHGGSAAPATGAPQAGPVTFTGTVTLSGADTARGRFTDTSSRKDPLGNVFASCQDWARHLINGAPDAGVDFVNPGPQAPVGGRDIGVAFLIQGYGGPGTYTQKSPGIRAEISDGLDSFGNPSSFVIVVNPDGSGHLTFTGASGVNGTSPAKKVSGSLIWTCR